MFLLWAANTLGPGALLGLLSQDLRVLLPVDTKFKGINVNLSYQAIFHKLWLDFFTLTAVNLCFRIAHIVSIVFIITLSKI
jgi:hypothetical protein